MTMNTQKRKKRLNMKDKYKYMTRLGWETTYQDMDDVFPEDKFEGIKIHDWEAWEDPFRMTMDAYWKYQGEKDKKLYAIIDAFAQNNGQKNKNGANRLHPPSLRSTPLPCGRGSCTEEKNIHDEVPEQDTGQQLSRLLF